MLLAAGSATFTPARARRVALACLAVCLAWMTVFAAPPAGAADEAADTAGATRLTVTIDGQPLGEGDLVLAPAAATRLVVTVENMSRSTVEIDTVRLSGTVLGLTFFDYDTRVRTSIPARGAATWTVDLDLRDLDGRANGAIPIEVSVRDRSLATVATASGTADVRGSLLSLYGLFGLGLAILMGLLWAVALLPMGRHAVPARPWQRGLRFVPAGCSVGLFVIFVLSATRLMAPSTATDFIITLGAAVACFAVGFATQDRSAASRV